jgi:hypothetical protein
MTPLARWPAVTLMSSFALSTGAAASPPERLIQIGGDDRPIIDGIWLDGGAMDIAEHGDIYLAIEHGYVDDTADPPHDIRFYRSRDGGDSWQPWGSIPSTTEYDEFYYLDLLVVEGNPDRCYLTYTLYDGPGNRDVHVAWSDLSAPE